MQINQCLNGVLNWTQSLIETSTSLNTRFFNLNNLGNLEFEHLNMEELMKSNLVVRFIKEMSFL